MMTPIVKVCPKLIIEGTRLTGKTDLGPGAEPRSRMA
jgi:hypothetical protein